MFHVLQLFLKACRKHILLHILYVHCWFQIRQDVYFMSSQKTKPSLFGLPLIVPCCESTTHQDLYQAVWVQVARLVSPLPPSETAAPNHAQDWWVNETVFTLGSILLYFTIRITIIYSINWSYIYCKSNILKSHPQGRQPVCYSVSNFFYNIILTKKSNLLMQ